MKHFFEPKIKDLTLTKLLTNDFKSKFGIVDVVNYDANKHANICISQINTIQSSSSSDICFFANGSYKNDLEHTKAAACFIGSESVSFLNKQTVALISNNPYFSFSLFASYLYGDSEEYENKYLDDDSCYTQNNFGAFIHKNAIVSRDCIVESGSIIHAFTTISSGVKVGKNTVVMQNCFIGKNVEIASSCYIYNNCSIFNAIIGEATIIRSGAVIGNLGFGFAADPKLGINKNQHIGGVIIGKSVDIGANTTIDRGYLTNTTIGDFTKIDNLVMVAHGVEIGSGCFIAGQTGIAGSAKLGNYVVCGAQVGIAGHLKICNGVTIAGKSGVISSIEEKGVYAGFPAVSIWLWRRMFVKLKNITTKN